MAKQATLAKAVEMTGVGLHEGVDVTMRLCPAPVGHGFVFVRTDRDNARIPAKISHVVEIQRRTLLMHDNTEVHTTEHVLAALYGVGITNAVIELSNAEPPSGDGSALDFVNLIDSAGIETQNADAREFAPAKLIDTTAGDATIRVDACDELRIDYTLQYDASEIPDARAAFIITPEVFREHIAPARTFCLEREALALQQAGFGKGANTQNTLVVGADGPIENSLRFDDEYARHKILDIIGDFALIGGRVHAHILAHKSGHSLNQRAAKELVRQTKELV